MRSRTILVLPGLIGSPDEESLLRDAFKIGPRFAEMAGLYRLRELGKVETPEAQWLGLAPELAQMAQGPLTVSAFGFDPPDRSTHFHVTPASLEDGIIYPATALPTAEETRKIVELSNKLNTKLLTFLGGDELDHALVWEGRGDLSTKAPDDAFGPPFRTVLPEGDAETLLRRFIDDSVNILAEQEFNLQRHEEGLQAVNILWPWGDGVRVPVPNLPVRRGVPFQVQSDSLRLQGLSRLAGYRHGGRHRYRSGINTDLAGLRSLAETTRDLLIVLPAFAELRSKNMLDEAAWLLRRVSDELIEPLLESAFTDESRFALVAPNADRMGLALWFEKRSIHPPSVYPFDERSLEERGLPLVQPFALLNDLLGP